MRITAKIATAGVAGLSRFPVANYTIDECTSPDGRLDPAKTRRALDVEQVQFGSRDDLAKLRASCGHLHNGNCSPCRFDCPLYMNGKCLDPMKEEV